VKTKNSSKYDELRFKLETDYIKPLIEILKVKYKKRKEAKNKTEKEAIDDSITMLTTLIGAYAEESSRTPELIVKFASEGLSIKAEKAGALYALSAHWSLVNHNDDKYSPQKAKKAAEKYTKNLKKDIKHEKIKYQVKTGKKVVTPDYYAKMDSKRRNYSRFREQKIQYNQELARACSPSPWGFGVMNQAKCQRYHKGMPARMEQMRMAEKMHSRDMNRLQDETRYWRKYELLGARTKRAEREEKYGDGFSRYNRGPERLFDLYDDRGGISDRYDDLMYDDTSFMYPDYGLEFKHNSRFSRFDDDFSSPRERLRYPRERGYDRDLQYLDWQ
jgi:hypothetical protein